jgi:membrane protease YdiL (CAAX protease family)
MERVYVFLPSILILVGLAIVSRIYLKLVTDRFKKDLNSIKWCKENTLKLVLMLTLPTLCVYAPALEELIFRAPLVVAFKALSPVAWHWIIVSSALFAATHWFGRKITIDDVLLAEKENNGLPTDNVDEEMKRLDQLQGKKKRIIKKISHVIFTFLLAILAGYYSIKLQSVWIAFGIHSGWNIVLPIGILFIGFLLSILFVVIVSLGKAAWELSRFCFQEFKRTQPFQ